MSIPVLAMPMFDPGQGRVNVELPEGLTLEAMVVTVLGDLSAGQRQRLRVVLTNGRGQFNAVPEINWHRVRPRAGIQVIMRLVPGEDALRNVLTIAVSVAAVALGQIWAPAVVGALGSVGGFLGTGVVAAGITVGLTALGGLLINALVPLRDQTGNGRNAEKPTFAISGWRNPVTPGGIIPAVMGFHRMAPAFAASNYTEIVGGEQYVRGLFNCGLGPVALSNLRLGETPLTSFSDVEIEIRQGYADDEPCQLYPQQVLEESLGVELRRDYPRDSSGAPVTGGGAGAETPISRVSAADIAEAAVIIGFPAGLISFNDEGDEEALSVNIRVEQRPIGGAWSTVTTLGFTGKQTEGFFRVHRWTLPARGRYEIRVTRVTAERTSTQQSDRTVWVALQGFRPEYPIAFGKPLALVALRVRATHQLNGALDTVNMNVSRICLDWDIDTQSWIMRETRNPASLYRWVLQGTGATYPEPDANLDLVLLADWHEFCTDNGLFYDRIHDFEASQWDVLADIAAAGRATPRHDGRKWGVVIDRAGEPVVDHINGGNARDFAWTRTYFTPPDGFRVSFLDSTNDFRSAERVVPWPGGAGDIEVTQSISLPGVTEPDAVWIETRRRMYELIYRPDRFTAVQAGSARRVTRGDRVIGAFDTLEHTLAVHRAVRVEGTLIELAGPVLMETGKSYACRYRVFGEDESMQSVIRAVQLNVGEQGLILLTGAGPMPAPGEWVHFGEAGKESIALIVTGIEAGEDMTSIISAVAEAPEIDALLATEVPPAWDGRVGGAIDNDTTAPAKPLATGLETHLDGFTVLLAPGAGSAVPVASFSLRHRLAGDVTWLGPVTALAGAGAVTLGGYDQGDEVEWQVQAISMGGVGSIYTDVATTEIPLPVGAPDPVVSASVTAGLGHASLLLATPDDERLDEVRIYRGNTSTFGTANLVATLVGVLPGSSYGHVDGDATRTNMVVNPGFDSGADWTLGTDWSIGAGKASKAPGAASALAQTVALETGETYRYRAILSDRTNGALSITLSGGTDVVGGVESSNGTKLGTMTALSGNDALAFAADTAFDGSVDAVVLFKQSPTSLAQGDHYYFITAANADGDESAPLALSVITVI